jgi:hypothetical protein
MHTLTVIKVATALAAVVSVAAADAQSYDTFEVGSLQGKVIVQWLKPDLFIFTPDANRPLTFIRKSGQKITPGRMLTDGGSIPRPLWILRNYSPWGYGPAFVVHDWLFEMHHCKYKGFEAFDYHIAATVMAEVMKTMMETKVVDVDKRTLESMYWAVDSPIAARAWNTGRCNPPPNDFQAKKMIQTYEFDFH